MQQGANFTNILCACRYRLASLFAIESFSWANCFLVVYTGIVVCNFVGVNFMPNSISALLQRVGEIDPRWCALSTLLTIIPTLMKRFIISERSLTRKFGSSFLSQIEHDF